MEYQEVKRTKLAFKGGKRKGAKREKDEPKRKQPRSSVAKENERHGPRGWVPVTALSDLRGPLAIYFRGEHLYTLSLPSSATDVQTLTAGGIGRPEFCRVDAASLMDVEPSQVEQVFVGRRSVPADASAKSECEMHSFKSSKDTYLSADRHGEVACTSAAIGALEMWTPVLLPAKGEGAVALKICPPGGDRCRYLTIDITSEPTDSRRLPVHARATSVGEYQVFAVKCQATLRGQHSAASSC